MMLTQPQGQPGDHRCRGPGSAHTGGSCLDAQVAPAPKFPVPRLGLRPRRPALELGTERRGVQGAQRCLAMELPNEQHGIFLRLLDRLK